MVGAVWRFDLVGGGLAVDGANDDKWTRHDFEIARETVAGVKVSMVGVTLV